MLSLPRFAKHIDARTVERIALIVVCCATALVYLSLLRAPFLAWDDDRNISANPYFLHLGWWRVWLEPYFGMYVPVTSSVWAGLFRAGDGAAWIFRAFNAAMHILNVVLVWHLLRTVLARGSIDPSNNRPRGMAIVLGTIVFAVHPLQSAAVAWISGGRDLLATALALGALLALVGANRRRYALATVLFTAGLLSKPSVAAVPVAVLAYVALFERNDFRRAFIAMSLWIALAAAVAVGTSAVQTEMTPIIVPIAQRPLVALDAVGFYLRELVLPTGLSIDHGRTPAWIARHPTNAAAMIGLACGAAIAFAVLVRRRRGFALGALWLVLIAPVLGLSVFSFQRISTVADHYVYLPMIAVALFVAIGASHLAHRTILLGALAAAMLVAGVFTTWRRIGVWRNDDALFADAVAKNPASFVALNNLARGACLAGRFDEGLNFAQRALAVAPTEIPALGNKAFCLFQSGAFDEVIEMEGALRDVAVQRNLEHDDVSASGLANIIAGALFQRGHLERGWPYLCQAIAIAPYDASLRENASDIARAFEQRGVRARCPSSRFAWSVLVRTDANTVGDHAP